MTSAMRACRMPNAAQRMKLEVSGRARFNGARAPGWLLRRRERARSKYGITSERSGRMAGCAPDFESGMRGVPQASPADGGHRTRSRMAPEEGNPQDR